MTKRNRPTSRRIIASFLDGESSEAPRALVIAIIARRWRFRPATIWRVIHAAEANARATRGVWAI